MSNKLIGIYNLNVDFGSPKALIERIRRERQDVRVVDWAPSSFPEGGRGGDVAYVDGILVISNDLDFKGVIELDDYLKRLDAKGYHGTMVPLKD